MGLFESEAAELAIRITAIINGVAIFIIFFSCRFIASNRLTKNWMLSGFYNQLYKFHSFFWWLLIPSVIVHIVITTAHILGGG